MKPRRNNCSNETTKLRYCIPNTNFGKPEENSACINYQQPSGKKKERKTKK
jgi:hypothetical protein